MLLLIRVVTEGAYTPAAIFRILGPSPLMPVALDGSSACKNSDSFCVFYEWDFKMNMAWDLELTYSAR